MYAKVYVPQKGAHILFNLSIVNFIDSSIKTLMLNINLTFVLP